MSYVNKITADTRVDVLSRLSKYELVGLLSNSEVCVCKGAKKSELLAMAADLIAKKVEIRDREVEEAEKARLVKLEEEKARPEIGRTIERLLVGLQNVRRKQELVLESFQARVAAGKGDLVSALEWKACDVFLAWAVLCEMSGPTDMVRRELEERTLTTKEMMGRFQDYVANLHRVLINSDEYFGGSTSTMANLKAACKFKAYQEVHNLLVLVLREFEKDLKELGTGELEHIVYFV